MNAARSTRPTVGIIENEIGRLCNILQRKAITDRIATFIVNCVFIPKILYRSTVQVLSRTVVNRITARYMKLIKKKAGLPITTPNAILFQRHIGGVKRLADALDEEQISSLWNRLRDNNLIGQLTRARLAVLQVRSKLDELPTRVPHKVTPYRHCLISNICRLMAERQITLRLNNASAFDLLDTAMSIQQWQRTESSLTSRSLARMGVFYVDQILTEDRMHLKPWATIRREQHTKGSSPEWFRDLQEWVAGGTYCENYREKWLSFEQCRLGECQDNCPRCEVNELMEPDLGNVVRPLTQDEDREERRRLDMERMDRNVAARRKAYRIQQRRERYMNLSEDDVQAMKERDANKAMDHVVTPIRTVEARLIPGGGAQGRWAPGVLVDDESWNMVMITRWALEQRSEPIVLYSDGSLKHMGNEKVSMSFASVYKCVDDTYQIAVRGRTTGFASSTKAELVGLFASVLCCPEGKDVIIYIDNNAVVAQFRTLVENRSKATPRQIHRSTFATWWEAVYEAYVKQGRKVKVRWIRGHSGEDGNEAADRWANNAHQLPTEPWTLDSQYWEKKGAQCWMRDTLIEDDLRKVLKLQSVVRNHYAWTKLQRTQRHIGEWKEIDWKSTMAVVHDGNLTGGRFTSQGDCQRRAHRIKKLHGMLPTLDYMRRWKPNLYPSDICRRCNRTTETLDHLWDCRTTLEDRKEEWARVLTLIPEDGTKACRRAVEQWNMDKEKAEERGITFTRRAPSFTPCDKDELWWSLHSIQGIEKLIEEWDDNWLALVDARLDQETNLADQVLSDQDDTSEVGQRRGTRMNARRTWSVNDIYHGLVPGFLTEEWARLMGTTTAIARYMAGRMVQRIEKFGREEIWGERCKLTVEWERTQGITLRMKKGGTILGGSALGFPATQAVSTWTREGAKEADERVQGNLLGKISLFEMERSTRMMNLLRDNLD